MRIADHAVALQSSQALQQPAVSAHQQQVSAPQVAIDAAAAEAQQKAARVNEQGNAEGKTIRGEEDRDRRDLPRKKRFARTQGATKPRGEEKQAQSGPDEEGHLDILV
jgi:hypothetical protein